MIEYPKIQTVFLRDPDNNHKTLLEGQYADPAFEYLKDNDWLFTEKVDGTNTRVMFDGNRVHYGGKTDNAQIHAHLLKVLDDMFPVRKMAEVFPDGGACLYGEGYGAKIQKGGGNYKSDGCSFVLFDVRVGDWWLERENVLDVAHRLDIMVVPSFGTGPISVMVASVRSGFKSMWGDFAAEGIVARPVCDLMNRKGDRIITKLKHKDFAHAPNKQLQEAGTLLSPPPPVQ